MLMPFGNESIPVLYRSELVKEIVILFECNFACDMVRYILMHYNPVFPTDCVQHTWGLIY